MSDLEDETRRLTVEPAVFKRLDKRREEKSAKYAINQGPMLKYFEGPYFTLWPLKVS
jgi:hypothetical protein